MRGDSKNLKIQLFSDWLPRYLGCQGLWAAMVFGILSTYLGAQGFPERQVRPTFDQEIIISPGKAFLPSSLPLPDRKRLDFTISRLPTSEIQSSTQSRDYIVKRLQDADKEVMKCLALVDGKPSRSVNEIITSLSEAARMASGDLKADLENLLISALAEKTLTDGDGSSAVYRVWTYRQINDVDALCGPTIVAHPGSTLLIPVLNLLDRRDLEIRDYPLQDPVLLGTDDVNTPHGFDVVNLHTHGLNVSPNWPSDDVFREIQPFQLKFFIYHLHEDHPVGTFWYHPHKHGSVSAQVGGGMAGALLVQGRSGHPLGLDKVAQDKKWGEEEPLILQQITAYQAAASPNDPLAPRPFIARPDFFALRSISLTDADEVKGIGPMVRWMKNNLTTVSPPIKTFVSGQYRPTLQSRKIGETYRLRLIHAGVDSSWNFSIKRINGEGEKPDEATVTQPGSDKLTMQVVAWDGMVMEKPYLLPPDGKLYLSPGNRTDLLVHFGNDTEGVYGIFNDAEDHTKAVARFSVKPGDDSKPNLLTEEEISIENLFKIPPVVADTPPTEIDIQFDPKRVMRDTDGGYQLTPGKFWINGSPFPGTPKINRVGLASPVHLRARRHPIHIHVNPLLLPEDPSRGALGLPTVRYWSDTVNVLSNNPGFLGIMPFDHFSGKAVVHCHILDHEDNGMMNSFIIRPQQIPTAPLPGIFDFLSFSKPTLSTLKPQWPSTQPQIGPLEGMVTVFAFLPRNASTKVCSHCANSIRSIASLRADANAPPFRIIAVTGPNAALLPEFATALKLDEKKDVLCADANLEAFQAFALIDGTPVFNHNRNLYTFPGSFRSDGELVHQNDVMHGIFVVDSRGFVVSSNRGFMAFEDSEQILSEISFAAQSEARLTEANSTVPKVTGTRADTATENDARINLKRQNLRLREFKAGIR